MNHSKKIISCLMAVPLVICSIMPITTVSASADDVVVYDASTFDTFKNRTAAQAAGEYSKYLYLAKGYEDGDVSTYYEADPSLEAPYSAGRLNSDTLLAMTSMTNYFRWLSGADYLKSVSANSDKLQAEALIRNFDFNHKVDAKYKPADMSDDLWNYGADLTHNILSWNYTPQSAVFGWVNEGYVSTTNEWESLGHRHTLLDPTISDITFGCCGLIGIGRVDAENNTFPEIFTAFPAPGYVPDELIVPHEAAWNVYIDTARLSVFGNANINVKITNLSTGKTFDRSLSEGTVSLQENHRALSFAQPDDYLGDPDNWLEPTYYKDNYRVEITGITDIASGKQAMLTYTVRFFDPTDAMDSYIDRTEIIKNNYIIYPGCASEEFLKKTAAILPREVTAYAQNGRQFTIPVDGAWQLDQSNNRWTAKLNLNALPEGIYDKNNVASSVEIGYTLSENKDIRYNTLEMPSEMNAGETGSVDIYRYMTTSDTSVVYKLTGGDNGVYTASERLRSDRSYEFDKSASAPNGDKYPYHSYNMKFRTPDSGEYISVYYNSNVLWHEVYVSNGTSTVTVNPTETGDLYIFGDVNDDDQVSSEDALNILRMSLDYDTGLLSGSADVDNDGEITSADALLVLRYSARLEDQASRTGEYF